MAYVRYGSPVDKQYRAALNLHNWLQQQPLYPHEPFPASAAVIDDFTGTDADIDGRIAVPSGREWTSPWPGQSDWLGGAWPFQTAGGVLLGTESSGYSSGLISGNFSRATNPVEAYVTIAGSPFVAELIMWCVSNPTVGNTDGYAAAFGDGCALWRLDNGAQTLIAQFSTPLGLGVGDRIGIRHDPDGDIHCFVDVGGGVLTEIGTHRDTTYAQGQFGLVVFDFGSLDDFAIGGDEVFEPMPDGTKEIEWPNPVLKIKRPRPQHGRLYNDLTKPHPAWDWPNPRGHAEKGIAERHLALKLDNWLQQNPVQPHLAYPTEALIDDFSGGDDPDIDGRTAVPSGRTWSWWSLVSPSAPAISGGAAVPGAAASAAYLSGTTTRANSPVEIFATITVPGSTGEDQVLGWLLGDPEASAAGYYLLVADVGFIILRDFSVELLQNLPFPISAGDKIGIRHDPDGTIHVFHDAGTGWNEIGQTWDDTYLEGKFILAVSNASSIDDLGGGGEAILEEMPPISQTNWPVPKGYRYPASLRVFVNNSPVYDPPPEPPQNRQNEWPVPKGRPYPKDLRGFTAHGPLYEASPPLRQDNWPVPRGYKYSQYLRTFINVGPHYAMPPISQQHWPVPKGRLYPKDLRTFLGVGPHYPDIPIRQDNWPVPKGRPYPTFLRTFLNLVLYPETPVGFGINYDFPNPRGRPYPRFLRNYTHQSDTVLYESFKPPLVGTIPLVRVPDYTGMLEIPDFTGAVNVPDYSQIRRLGG